MQPQGFEAVYLPPQVLEIAVDILQFDGRQLKVVAAVVHGPLHHDRGVVHVLSDANVGAAPYQVPAEPLAANQAAILVQNAAQQLPWQPGLINRSRVAMPGPFRVLAGDLICDVQRSLML